MNNNNNNNNNNKGNISSITDTDYYQTFDGIKQYLKY